MSQHTLRLWYNPPMSAMPKIGPIRWRKDGFGIQILAYPKTEQLSRSERPKSALYQRGYIKIWYRYPYGNRVVDRALKIRAAYKRIAELKSNLVELKRRDYA